MNQGDGLWLTPREYEKQNKSSMELEERIRELEEKNADLWSAIRASEKAMDRFMNSTYTGTHDDILAEIDDALRQCTSVLYADRYRR